MILRGIDKVPLFKDFNLIRTFKTLHGWLGVMILPWVISIGLTGLYMNHSKLVLSFLNSTTYDESQFDEWPNQEPVDLGRALDIANSIKPGAIFSVSKKNAYHNRDVFILSDKPDRVIVDKKTGHYWVKTPLTWRLYNPDGLQLDHKFYWGALFKRMHQFGWINNSLGTWLVDIAAGALTVFGITGLTLFLSPRLRRRQNRKMQAKMMAARAAAGST